MRVTLEDGLRALRESTDIAKTIRIDLDDPYLRAIAVVEAVPQNQSGANKAWVQESIEAFTRHFAAVRGG